MSPIARTSAHESLPDGYRHIPHGFEPIFDEQSRVLVLGSFPSVLSRENSFYYGNPRNRFWQVMSACTGIPLAADEPLSRSIEAKTDLLLHSGVALWDVIAACDIKGSSDASIRNAQAVDIDRLVRAADIRCIICNGATAGKLFARHLRTSAGMDAVVLPSTSPANAAWSLPRLTRAWNDALAPYLLTRG